MFRLVNDSFKENEKLYKLAIYCVTETIKAHLEEYFEEDYIHEKEEMLYTKVILKDTYELFQEELLEGINNIGIDINTFIPKKMAQLMLLLNKQEEETPDIFLEYILYKMMVKQTKSGFDYIPWIVEDKKNELKKLLRDYAKKELEFDEIKERNKFVKDNITLLTNFTSFMGVEEPDDDSLVFWDWDFAFFDDWGFETCIKQLANGIFAQSGYGLEYTKSIFTSVGEKIPNIIN